MTLVLVVDDEPDICSLIEKILVHEGYEVITASNASEAWEVLERHHPDLMLLDVDMPGETGVEMVLKLRRSEKLAKMLVIFVTAFPERTAPLQSTGLGAAQIISKPFRREDLLGAIKKKLNI